MISLRELLSSGSINFAVVNHLTFGEGVIAVVCSSKTKMDEIRDTSVNGLTQLGVAIKRKTINTIETERGPSVIFVLSKRISCSLRGRRFTDILFTDIKDVLKDDVIQEIHRLER